MVNPGILSKEGIKALRQFEVFPVPWAKTWHIYERTSYTEDEITYTRYDKEGLIIYRSEEAAEKKAKELNAKGRN